MNTLRNGYRGLSLLVDLNWDRMFNGLALVAALALSVWLASQTGAFPVVERI